LEQAFPEGTTIIDVYRQAVNGLLILGEPGTGKTTLLYDLAQALLNQAEQDETFPLPVVLSLSSWATKRQPLDLWLAEELEFALSYSTPIGSRWIQEERFPVAVRRIG